MKVGDKVHYIAFKGSKPENGIVKEIRERDKIAFIVYKCDNQWIRYRDFTGCSTKLEDLKMGWVQ